MAPIDYCFMGIFVGVCFGLGRLGLRRCSLNAARQPAAPPGLQVRNSRFLGPVCSIMQPCGAFLARQPAMLCNVLISLQRMCRGSTDMTSPGP